MRTTFQVGADSRHDEGKGASRRLRRAGKVPAILYGGHGAPQSVVLDHQQLLTLIDNERFYSSIISLNLDSQPQPAIVRDVQLHPARNAVVHVDLQRVTENEPLKIRLPIHFKGAAQSPGVKTQGGIVHHLIQDVEISCLPEQLPEYLELDLSAMNLNDTLTLADIALPPGVTLPQLRHGNAPVVTVHAPRVVEVETEAATAAAGAAAGAPGAEAGAAGAAATAGAAGAAAGGAGAAGGAAKKEEARKEEGSRKDEGKGAASKKDKK
ncbi:MAG TPA: 50S ribosomal protein L25/general stress protein Ctc [Steroidobacteraceae bacterium]|nr:50S ribosomal protein L25/general stress protein Ctc [Steroidobacteraceae bacterium]